MKKLLAGLTAVLAAGGVAWADDPKPPPSRPRSNQPPTPVVQNGYRPSAAGITPRYSNQMPRLNAYSNLPQMRHYAGSLPLQNNGIANRPANWRSRQFDNRTLADQNTNGTVRRSWHRLDLDQRGDPN